MNIIKIERKAPDGADLTERNECWFCRNRYPIPGNCHIGCSKPDPDMTGEEYGIRNNWFSYPYCFDPVWKTKLCCNFEQEGA